VVIPDNFLGYFIVAAILLPFFPGIPLGLGWLLDRLVPSDEGPRIVLCMLVAEGLTLTFLGHYNLAGWNHIIVFPPIFAAVLAGYFVSRWRKRVADKTRK
jgi:hypothetical protein